MRCPGRGRSSSSGSRISGTGQALLEEARRLGYVRPGEHLFIVHGVKEWLATHPNAPGRQK